MHVQEPEGNKLTQSSEHVPLCIREGLSLFHCNGLGEFFLKHEMSSVSICVSALGFVFSVFLGFFLIFGRTPTSNAATGFRLSSKDWFCRNQGQIVQYSTQLHLHLILPDPLTYNVIFDHLLIAQEDLLPSQDGSLWPGAKGSWAWVDGSRHLLMGGFGYTVDHLISSLQAVRIKINKCWSSKFTQGSGSGDILTGLCTSSHSEVLDSINFPSMNSLVVGCGERYYTLHLASRFMIAVRHVMQQDAQYVLKKWDASFKLTTEEE